MDEIDEVIEEELDLALGLLQRQVAIPSDSKELPYFTDEGKKLLHAIVKNSIRRFFLEKMAMYFEPEQEYPI